MKRIELVIEPAALDRFTETAQALNLSDFDITEVRRTTSAHQQQRQRLYRGRAFTLDLVERLKVDITVADELATKVAQGLIASLAPESITILRLDQAMAVRDLPASVAVPFAPESAAVVH